MKSKNSIVKLKTSTYDMWADEMEDLLRYKGLWDAVANDITADDIFRNGSTNENSRINSKAIGRIRMELPAENKRLADDVKTAKELWDKIKKYFNRKTFANLDRWNQDFNELKLQKGDNVQSHIHKLETLRLKLDGTEMKISDAKMNVRLLRSLGPDWKEYNKTLRARYPDLKEVKYEDLKDEILEEATYDDNQSEEEEKPRAFQTGGRKEKPEKRTCFNCGKLGHVKKDCWAKGGGREGEGPSSSGKKNGRYPKKEKKDGDVKITYLLMASAGIESGESWILDTGATEHFCNRKSKFIEFKALEEPRQIATAKKENEVAATGIGKIRLETDINGNQVECILSDVLYIPKLERNLVSMGRLIDKGCNFEVVENTMKTKIDGKTILQFTREEGGLFELENLATGDEKHPEAYMAKQDNMMMWHRKFMHLNEADLKLTVGNLKGTMGDCEPCMLGKATKLRFNKEKSYRPKGPLEEVHCDIMGPLDESTNGNRYLAVYVDRFTDYTYAVPLKKKSQQEAELRSFIAMAETNFEKKVKRIVCDGGGEFITNSFIAFCKERGTEISQTNPYEPNQNPVAERRNRILTNAARAALTDSGVPLSYWDDALMMAAYARNRSLSTWNKEESPATQWNHGKKEDISKLHVFGELCYALKGNQKAKPKMESNAEKCVFLGYTTNGYRLKSMERNKTVYSRNVSFPKKLVFPYRKTVEVDDYSDSGSSDDDNADKERKAEGMRFELQREDTDDESVDAPNTPTPRSRSPDSEEYRLSSDEESGTQVNVNRSPRPKRDTQRPATYAEVARPITQAAEAYMTTVSPNGIKIPKSYYDAIHGPEAANWKEAIKSELRSLTRNQTWVVKERKGRTLCKVKWIFSLKLNEHGNVERYKARLVARGFTQIPGIDFEEAYAPVVRAPTIRLALALKTQKKMKTLQLDISTAFLHGKMDKEVFIEMPQGLELLTLNEQSRLGLEGMTEDEALCLMKALYGTKQGARQWNIELKTTLRKMGYRQSDYDPCLFIRGEEFVIIYVDDLLLFYHNEEEAKRFEEGITEKYAVGKRDDGHYFLGQHIATTSEGTNVNQVRYIEKMKQTFSLDDYAMKASRPIGDPNGLEVTEKEKATKIGKPYRELIGALLYVSNLTRPDISFAVGVLSRHLEHPQDRHWKAAVQLGRYVCNTKHLGLKFKKTSEKTDCLTADDIGLELYCDADWAADKKGRRSMSGVLIMMLGAPIYWRSVKQKSVAQSTMEAEYVALAEGVKNLMWVKGILGELGIDCSNPTRVYEDNNAALELAKNPVMHSRAKHIDVKFHFVRDEWEKRSINIIKIETKRQLADILTKSLGKERIEELRTTMGITTGTIKDATQSGSVTKPAS